MGVCFLQNKKMENKMKKRLGIACAAIAVASLTACDDEITTALNDLSTNSSSSYVDPFGIYSSSSFGWISSSSTNLLNSGLFSSSGNFAQSSSSNNLALSSSAIASSSSISFMRSSSSSFGFAFGMRSSSSIMGANSSSSLATSSPATSAPSTQSSSSAPAVAKIEGVYDYAKGNDPAPSKGCGKASSLQKTKSVENGDRFEMNVAGLTREYFITLPSNYDNNKPHKLLFAMHCMGSNAEDFVHHSPDQDHPSPYYGQQKLDTEGNYIFVAPRGDTDGMPWRMSDDKDHQFFDELLTTMEDNYCIDTSRVFVTGFSFGSMYSNSLAQDFQHRVRAVVTYAVADWNIYIPTNKGKPIAWMNVHGTQDNTCTYSRMDSAIKRILKNNGPNGTDVSDEVNSMQKFNGQGGHVCYDFKNVDQNHPVRVCTWGGPHQWTAYDNGNWQNTWVPEDVHKFIEQF